MTMPESLTVNDLVSIREILNIACTRGAFKGSEMTAVGTVFDKLNKFLSVVQAHAEAQVTQPGESND